MIIITILGRLGTDPEARVTADGKKVTTLSVGTSVGVGEKKETVWWKVSIWGDRFQKLLPYLTKGKQVSVTGTITRAPQIFTPKTGGEPRVSSIELSCDMIHLVQGDKREEGTMSQSAMKPSNDSYSNNDDLPF